MSDDMDPEKLSAMFAQWAEEGFACRPYMVNRTDNILYTYGAHKSSLHILRHAVSAHPYPFHATH